MNEDVNEEIKQLKLTLHEIRLQCAKLVAENALLHQQLNVCKEDAETQVDDTQFLVTEDIAESLRKTAENEVAQSGYTYDERTGLYYHQHSGYYYDPDAHLFYDPRSGNYFIFNEDTKQYVLHSQEDQNELQERYHASLIMTGIQHLPPAVDENNISNSDQTEKVNHTTFKIASPLRLIVQVSNNLESGYLYVITPHCPLFLFCEINNRDDSSVLTVRIAEVNDSGNSQSYYQIRWDEEDNNYVIASISSPEQFQSAASVFINGKQVESHSSNPMKTRLKHEDQIKIGTEHEFLCHLHADSLNTCEECEPGLVSARWRRNMQRWENDVISIAGKNVDDPLELQRRKMASSLKKKYFLNFSPYENTSHSLSQANYVDRAEKRRQECGSVYDIMEDTLPASSASLFQPISDDNKGCTLLRSMGWREGEGLGKSGGGLLEPLLPSGQARGKEGLGFRTGRFPVSTSSFVEENGLKNIQTFVRGKSDPDIAEESNSVQ